MVSIVICRSSATDYPATRQPHVHVSLYWRNCKRSVRNGARRSVAALTVKRDDIARSVDLPRVCIARGVDIVECIVASPIGPGVTTLCYVERSPRKLAFGNGGAQDEWCWEESAFIRVVNFRRD